MNTRHLSNVDESDDESSFDVVSAMLDAGPSPAAERARSLVGTVVSGRYQVRELIAMGGMGAVYRGEHIHLRKRLAIKVLHPEIENLPELVERFRREALVGAHARHPHVAAATDFGTLDDGSYFLVLEHVRGVTLHEIVRRGPLAPARAVHVARQLAAALDSLHARGIMHRDVKPHNVMIVNPTGRETAEGEELSNDDTVGPDFVKLIDFGLATVELERLTSIEMTVEAPPDSSPPARLTGSGAIFGTLAYLAPEAALGMDAVDARGDLYALGVVIYEMLTGRRPFTGETAADVIAQHVSAPPPPFAEVVPELYIPASLERITLRLLAKDPAERFQRGADVVAALAAALAEISARVTHDTPATLRKIPTRGPWPLPDPLDSAPPGAPPELPSAPPRAQASAPPRVQASGPPRAQVSAPPPLPPVSALPAAPPPRPSAPVPVPPSRLPMPTPPPRQSAPVPPPRLPMPTPPPRQSAPVPMPGLPTPPPRPSAPSLQGALPAPPAAAKSGASAPSLPRADEMPELAPLSNPTLGVESSEFDDIVSEAPGRTTQAMMPIAPDELGPDPADAVEPTTLAMMPVASDQLGLEPPSHPTLAIAPRVPDEYGLVPPSLPTLAMEPSPFAAPPVRAAPDTIVTPPPSASSYDLASPAPEAAAAAPRGGLPSPSPLAYVAALLLPVLAAALYLAFSRGPKPPEPEVTVAEAPVEATAAPKAAPPDAAPNAAPPGTAAADPAPRPSAPADPALDPERLRAQVRQATKNYDYESGRKALVALAAVNPASLSRADLRRAAAEVVTGAEEMGKPGSDELFAALASASAAPHGPDLLYDVVQLHGGRKSAKRALDLLRQPDVIARASPALRITVAFRDADCPRREGLAERAAAEGDARTLALIKVSLGGCGSSPPLEKAERALSLSTAPKLPARPASRAAARAGGSGAVGPTRGRRRAGRPRRGRQRRSQADARAAAAQVGRGAGGVGGVRVATRERRQASRNAFPEGGAVLIYRAGRAGRAIPAASAREGTMSELILHHYDSSPFAEKVRLVLGFKGLAWHSVTVPVVLPKPDVVALTGGYRRTPFLQIGADVYCDTALVCRVLDRVAPEPPLYPASGGGHQHLVAQWADSALFWTAVPYTLQPAGAAFMFGGLPPAVAQGFLNDRAAMTAGLRRPAPADARAQLETYFGWLESSLADGRPFLLGDAPCIADFSTAHPVWFLRRVPPVADVLEPFAKLRAWSDRVSAFGRGSPTPLSSDDALGIAARSASHAPAKVEPGRGFEAGAAVTVSAVDYATDPINGTLVGLTSEEVVVERRDERAGTVHVHFPRIGYQVKKGDA